MQVKKQQLEMDKELVPNWERSISRLYIVTLLMYLIAEYIMWNVRLDEAQAGIKIARRNINNFRYGDDTTLVAESEEEPLDKSERGEWESWLKTEDSEN